MNICCRFVHLRIYPVGYGNIAPTFILTVDYVPRVRLPGPGSCDAYPTQRVALFILVALQLDGLLRFAELCAVTGWVG